MPADFLPSAHKEFAYYKWLGDQALARVPPAQLFWQPNPASNSMATVVKHLWGNMLSRWTDFLAADGEKPWRDQDAEFATDPAAPAEVLARWRAGWQCLFGALDELTEADLGKAVFIRNQGHTVLEAINRQLAHYPYHVGQLVFLGKLICGDAWPSLSIPRGESAAHNAGKFARPPHRAHFPDGLLGGPAQ